MSCTVVVVHVALDPRIPTTPGRGTSGFPRPGRHLLCSTTHCEPALGCRASRFRVSGILLLYVGTVCEGDIVAFDDSTFFSGIAGGGGRTRSHAWPESYNHRPSHPYNAGTEHVGFFTDQTKGGVYSISCMAVVVLPGRGRWY